MKEFWAQGLGMITDDYRDQYHFFLRTTSKFSSTLGQAQDLGIFRAKCFEVYC